MAPWDSEWERTAAQCSCTMIGHRESHHEQYHAHYEIIQRFCQEDCPLRRMCNEWYAERTKPQRRPVMPEGIAHYLKFEDDGCDISEYRDKATAILLHAFARTYYVNRLAREIIIGYMKGRTGTVAKRRTFEMFAKLAGYPPLTYKVDHLEIDGEDEDDDSNLMCAACKCVNTDPIIYGGGDCTCEEVRGVCRHCFLQNGKKCIYCRNGAEMYLTDTARKTEVMAKYGERIGEHIENKKKRKLEWVNEWTKDLDEELEKERAQRVANLESWFEENKMAIKRRRAAMMKE